MTARIVDLVTDTLGYSIEYAVDAETRQPYQAMDSITVEASSTINFYITLNTNDISIDINDIILSFSLSQAAE